MLRHVVTWNYGEGFSEAENKENALIIKRGLESLTDCISGIIEIKVYINELSTSNRDLILNSLFESEVVLAEYQNYPEHKKVGEFISSVLQNRTCIDYYE